MSNSIKYNASAESLALNTGDFWIGTGDVGKGDTETTGFWSAINPPIAGGGYTIYLNKSTQGPSIYVASDDAELITLTNDISGNSYTTINQCFDYFITQDDKFVLNSYINPIITDGLVLALDASLVPSYPRSGTDWLGLREGINGTLSGPTYNTVGALDFNGSSDYVEGNSSVPLGNPCTVIALINCNSGGSGEGVAFGPEANGSDNWLAVNGTTIRAYACESADINNFTLQGGTIVCDGTRWCTIACTIDGSTLKVYLNGVEKNAVTKTFTIGGWTGGFDVGRRGNHSLKYFNGSISNVLGYDKVLTPSEMLQNYYQAPIVTDDLLQYYDFSNIVCYDGADGLASGNVINMVDGSTAAINNTSSGITYNKSLGYMNWDGTTTDNIDIPNTGFLDTFTLSAWVYNELGGDSSHSILRNYWEIEGTKLKYFSYEFASEYWRATNSLSVPHSEWSNITTTWDGEKIRHYVNGILLHTSPPSSGTSQDILSIGGYSGRALKGRFGILSIYEKCLTPDEVTQNYSAHSYIFSPPDIP